MKYQTAWQRKMVAQRRCRTCGDPIRTTSRQHCEIHRLMFNRYLRERYQRRKR